MRLLQPYAVAPSAVQAFIVFASFAIALALLYFLRPVLIPLALAALLTFVLNPLVTVVQRRGVPRTLGVAAAVALSCALIAGVGSLVVNEMNALVDSLPRYEHNLRLRIAELKGDDGGLVAKFQRAFKRIKQQVESDPAPLATLRQRRAPAEDAEPVPVRAVAEPLEVGKLWSSYGPMVGAAAGLALALVLVVFMLIGRDDLRDRVISAFGRGRLTVTTKALDEAGARISRYLVMQLAINGGFGIVFGIGVALIGLPYALTWGFFAAILRYIPYLGAWLAALLPLGLAVLISPSWTVPVLVGALFIALEMLTSLLIEPRLYGRRVGVSEIAALVMVAFWTWLWGPIGLVLAMPLTVCLVLLGKYVPALGFFDTLLGDRPALEPALVFYQRLLARDRQAAAAVLQRQVEEGGTLAAAFDELVVGALVRARGDRAGGRIDAEDAAAVLASTRELVGGLAKAQPAAAGPRLAVLGIPANREDDEVALAMLAALARAERCDFEIAGNALLAGEALALVEARQARIVCIAALAPGGGAHARLLCRRLRARYPSLRILVSRLGLAAGGADAKRALAAAGADLVATTLAESRTQLASFVPILCRGPIEADLGRPIETAPAAAATG